MANFIRAAVVMFACGVLLGGCAGRMLADVVLQKAPRPHAFHHRPHVLHKPHR